MKNLVLVLSLFVSFAAVASPSGPSVSGGVPQAPWVRNQSIISQVLEYVNENRISVKGIEVTAHSQEAVATVYCSNGRTTRMVFDVKSKCQQTTIMCMPYVEVEMNSAKSTPCAY